MQLDQSYFLYFSSALEEQSQWKTAANNIMYAEKKDGGQVFAICMWKAQLCPFQSHRFFTIANRKLHWKKGAKQRRLQQFPHISAMTI